MALLELQSVRAGYGVGPDILTDVSIDVEAGGTYVVIGPNGAGKSTMLKVISGLLTPRDGTVVFDGESIGGRRPDQILGAGICFVPQDRTVFPEMTVRENLMMVPGGQSGETIYNAWIARKRIAQEERELLKKADEVLEFLTIDHLKDEKAGNLSGGQAPIVAEGVTAYSSPLPHVLILTAIVVGVATTAVGVALVVRIKEAYGSVEEDDIQAKDLADDESARKGCGPEQGDEPQ